MFPKIPARSFYMLRHGQTQANLGGVFSGGGVDTPLTEEGRAQAREAAMLVAALPIRPVAIVHSHLSRARDTARIVNEAMNLEISEDRSLGEQVGGEMEGQPFEQFRDLVLQDKDPPGGEPLPVFRERVRRGIAAALERDESPVLIVSHGGLFRAFGDLYGFVLRGVGNCHLYEFEPRTGARAEVPWDIFHWQKNGEEITRTRKIS